MTIDALTFRRMIRPVGRVLRDDFLRHSALVFAASMAGNVLNYAFNFALSRRLGVEGYATLSSLTSFLMLLSIPTSVLTLVVVKYAAVFHAANDAQRIRRLSELLLKFTGIAALCAFIAGMAASGSIAAFLRIPDNGAIVLCVAIIALGLVTPSLRGILQGEQDFFRYSISTVVEAFLKVSCGVLLVYAGYGPAGAMLGWTIGTLCALAYTVWAVMSKHGSKAGPRFRLALDGRRLFSTTLGVGLTTAFLTCISFMDVLLVKHYFAPHHAGLYAAVNLTGKVILFLAASVPAVVLPKAASKSARGDNPVPMLVQAAGATLLMCAVPLLLFGLLPAQTIRLIAGSAFAGAAPYVFQYDLAMALLAMVTLVANYKMGLHRFNFLYALGVVLVAEVAGIATLHHSLWDVIHILLAGNAVLLACSLYRIVPPGSAQKLSHERVA